MRRLILTTLLVALTLLLLPDSAHAQPSHLAFVLLPQGENIPERDLLTLRQLLAARLTATQQIAVAPPGAVESRLRQLADQRGTPCTPYDRSCVLQVAQTLHINLLIEPFLRWDPERGLLTLHLNLIDTQYAWNTVAVEHTTRSPGPFSNLRPLLDHVTEELHDWLRTDPWLRSQGWPLETDEPWIGLRTTWIPAGEGTLRLRTPDGDAQVPYADDALYAFHLLIAWLQEGWGFGAALGWTPAQEFELDGDARHTLRQLHPQVEDGLTGRSGDSNDLLEINLFAEGLAPLGLLFNSHDLAELMAYADLEAGLVLAFPDRSADGNTLPHGWSAGGGLGLQLNSARREALRLGVHARWLHLQHSLPNDASLTAQGWQLQLTLAFLTTP